jgi:hypothetical protein
VEKCRDRRPRRANVLEFKGGNVVKLNGKGSVCLYIVCRVLDLRLIWNEYFLVCGSVD